MNKSLKAALLSGLVFPGAGELWLRHWARGLFLALAASASLAVILARVAHQAISILERIEAEGGAVDLVAIANLAHASSTDDLAARCAVILLAACWVAGTVDAYLLGKKEGSGGADS